MSAGEEQEEMESKRGIVSSREGAENAENQMDGLRN